MRCSALILAGGKSRRMGRDKARLELAGRPLLARQIELARELRADKIFISGRAGADYAAFGCEVLFDFYPEAGPLAGVERGLATATAPFLLVLQERNAERPYFVMWIENDELCVPFPAAK